uniref:Uncharacterized protein n=1 Tax=viral metagenome TaxID=1070528 RepID=A0A6M3LWS0_9ZZZZ
MKTDKLAEGMLLKEKMLKTIFDELEKKSYDIDFHGYHYKEANQIIRHFFEILIDKSKLAEVTDEDIEKWATDYLDRLNLSSIITREVAFESLLFSAKAMREGFIKHT